jgi:hypothetical protein
VLLALLIGCSSPQPPPAVYTAPSPSQLGLHTRLTDEAEVSKINRTLDEVAGMGASWIVEYFPWAYHEPSPGRYEWPHVDQVVAAAQRHGVRVLARIDMVPAWARPPGSSPKLLTSDRYVDYVAFLSRFAERYAGRIEGIIVWNEPNLSFEWGSRPVSSAQYVELLRQAHDAIKTAAPDVAVIAAGLAPTLEQSEQALSDLEYLAEIYVLGGGSYFDALAAHAYGFRIPPEQDPAADRVNFRRVELLRKLMEQAGDADKPVYVTETGWNDHPRWTKAVRPAERIRYTTAALDLAAANWPWARAVCLWAFRLPALAHNYNDYYTLLTTEFERKPIYETLKERSERLGLTPDPAQ